MRRYSFTAGVSSLLVSVALCFQPMAAQACPGCTPLGKTIREETKSMGIVVIAKLVTQKAPPAAEEGTDGFAIAKSTFEVVEVLKGAEHMKGQKTIDTFYFEKGNIGKLFLILATAPPEVLWSTPALVSEEAVDYARKVMKLPEDDVAGNLRFFLPYLNHKDPVLKRDSYDEFAITPYDQLIKVKDALDHDLLVKMLQDPETPTTERRLYFMLLSICGTAADVPLLEGMLKAEDNSKRLGLDTLITCYLALNGAKGLPVVEELFLSNAKASFSDTYSTVNAIRIHGTDLNVLSKSVLKKSLRVLLDRPELADLVIADLTRWEDWESLNRLAGIFKTATPETRYVRIPIVRFALKCPLPEAKTVLAEFEKIDADSVKRAKAIPFGTATKMAITNQSPSANDVPANVVRPEDKKKKPDAGSEAKPASPQSVPPQPATDSADKPMPPVPPADQPQSPAGQSAADLAPAPPAEVTVAETSADVAESTAAKTPVAKALAQPATPPQPAPQEPAIAPTNDDSPEIREDLPAKKSASSYLDEPTLAQPNLAVVLSITGGAGMALFVALWLILRSAGL